MPGTNLFKNQIWEIQSHWQIIDHNNQLVDRSLVTHYRLIEILMQTRWQLICHMTISSRNQTPGIVVAPSTAPGPLEVLLLIALVRPVPSRCTYSVNKASTALYKLQIHSYEWDFSFCNLNFLSFKAYYGIIGFNQYNNRSNYQKNYKVNTTRLLILYNSNCFNGTSCW